MTIIARAGRAARANSASRSLPAGSGAGFRWQLLAIPASRRPKHRQPRDHGQPMKPGVSIGESRQPLSVAPDGNHRRQPPAAQLGQTRRLDCSLPAAAPGSAGRCSRSRKPAGQGTANHGTKANSMKPGASIGETQQPFPGAPDGENRQSRPRSAGKFGRPERPWSAAAPGSAAGTPSRSRQPAGQGTAKHASTGNPGRLDRSLPAAAPGSAGTRSRSRQPAGQGSASHATTANPTKPGASIVDTRQPFPVAPDGDHRRQPPAGQIGQIRAPRSPPAGSGARFSRRHSLAIPAARRPRHCQARERGQPRASRSLPAGSGAGFRWPLLAIPETGRPRHCQPRDQGQLHEARRLDR